MIEKVACYGVPSVFSFKSKVCAGCGNFDDCQKESYSALLSIREYPIATVMLSQHVEHRMQTGQAQNEPTALNINKPIPTHSKAKVVRYALTAEQIERIAEMPKKIGNFLSKIWVRGLDKQIAEDITLGKNPFSLTNARPYHTAFEIIRRGKTHRSRMSNELMDVLGWTYASSYSQVSMIWQIFPELGIAKIEGVHMVTLHPNLREHNNEKSREGTL